MSDPNTVVRLFGALDTEFGRLQLLVNNAGILPPPSRVGEFTEHRVQQTFAINALAPLLCAREAVRRMSTERNGTGGVIVNVSSPSAVRGASGERVDYAMSKAALDALTIGLAGEAAAGGVRVVGVRPGLIDTEMNNSSQYPDRLKRLMSTVPLGRAGTAEEVAEAIRWLASDAASYVTGVVLDVSGGR